MKLNEYRMDSGKINSPLSHITVLDVVVKKMKVLFDFLDAKGFLQEEGKEVLDLGIDGSVSIHERMLTEEGNKFMESKYDSVINTNEEEFNEALEIAFEQFEK